MDVGGVGMGAPVAEISSELRGLARTATSGGPAQLGDDTFVSDLHALSKLEVTGLLSIIERPESPQTVELLNSLLSHAVAATAKGDGIQAMAHLAEFAAISPQRAETLGSLPSLSSIRAPIERLVSGLNTTAKVEAENQLAQAVKLMESMGSKELVIREIRAENLVLIAGRLLNAGGYANAVMSSQLSQMVIDPRFLAPDAVPLPAQVEGSDGPRPAAGGAVLGAPITTVRPAHTGPAQESRIRHLWVRAPLLVLLLTWFVLGLVGGVLSAIIRNYWPRALTMSVVSGGFELWALGFLFLVAFGFYVRVRNLRF